METNMETESQKSPYFHFFLISGEVSYVDNKFNKSPKHMKVNGVHQCAGEGLTAQELGKIQTGLQMNFFQKFFREHKTNPPEVTDVVISTISYLGMFLPEDFFKREPEAQTENQTQTPTEKMSAA